MSMIKDWLAWNRNNVSEWIDVYPSIPNVYRYISIISWQSILLAGAKEHVTYSLSSLRVGRRLPDGMLTSSSLKQLDQMETFLYWPRNNYSEHYNDHDALFLIKRLSTFEFFFCLPEYLQDLSEVLLFLLLPQEDFHNKSFRYILRVSTDIELILFLLFKLSFLNVWIFMIGLVCGV